jgi:hypothetical protein
MFCNYDILTLYCPQALNPSSNPNILLMAKYCSPEPKIEEINGKS